MKDIHPNIHQCTYKCVTCHKEFLINTASKQNEVLIEVCSGCHPFYIGKQNASTTLRGRAEKLNTMFQTGLKNVNAKPTKKEAVKKSKPKQSLSSL
ncbi:50S ribosomal protein L31 [Ureaplasma canigenitalium]|uniref:50S ribosomal protein L31 n=1 Tax=Ureaplasma canigenitalium TaxID=42092 RepID=UPI0004E0D29F|nr:50S ribosomal protein L31 [Ureaplasma canigenitalium]